MKLHEAVKHLKQNAEQTGITDSKLFQYFYDYMTTYRLDDMYISEMEVDSILDFIEAASDPAVTCRESGTNYVFSANGKNYLFPKKNVMPDRLNRPICEMSISRDLYDAIKRASKFVLRGKDPMLLESYVNIRFNEKTCIVTSTAGHTLVTAGYETESFCSVSLNISYKVVDVLPKEYPTDIRVYNDAIQFVYSDYDITVFSNVDRYFPYEDLIVALDINTDNHLPYCTVNRKSLLSSINELSKLFQKPKYIRLKFNESLDVHIYDDTLSVEHHAPVDFQSNFLSGEYLYKVRLEGLIPYLKTCDTDLLYIVPMNILYMYAHERWAMFANCL